MKLLLITGAGASRDLGQEKAPMPLMANWSDHLCRALDDHEQGLAEACGLRPGADGPEFERRLGLLLNWAKVRPLAEEFRGLEGRGLGEIVDPVTNAHLNIKRRLEEVLEILKETLYDQFGHLRVDDQRATAAYRELLKELKGPELIVATTNYDRIAETALASLGHQVSTGFPREPNRTPTLNPLGLVTDRGESIPVIHLHGAVGWYEDQGQVKELPADLPYNRTLGTPVILYPDPEKDPTNDPAVKELWLEFEAAVEEVDAILVIGHSLHDPALVARLRAVAREKPTAITFRDPKGAAEIEHRVPGASAVEMTFGPDIEVWAKELHNALGGLSALVSKRG